MVNLGRLLIVAALSACCLSAGPHATAGEEPLGNQANRPARLPRYDVERPTREEPKVLEPYALQFGDRASTAPTTGIVRPHPEYAPMAGVIFLYDRFGWPEIVTEMVAELTRPGYDEIAWVIVPESNQLNRAQRDFENAGAEMSKVAFLTLPNESLWLRDYGPQFVRLDDTIAIVDLRYFGGRPNDNFTPKALAKSLFASPTYDLGLYHFGGNYLGLGTGYGFAANILTGLNQDFGQERVLELFAEYHGIHTLHLFPTLPASVDATGHIDMWLQFADEDTVVIAEFLPGSDATAIAITDNAAAYMTAQGFEVFRVPALNDNHPWADNTHFTYTNSFRVNDRIFVPVYGRGGPEHAARDTEALATWALAAPDAEIVPIDTWDLIYAAGAVHCVVMQVPRFTSADPAANVLSPSGGEILIPGESHPIGWVANDDASVAEIDLHYSTDGGIIWTPIALGESHDTTYDWLVPDDPSNSTRVKVVARDAEGRTGESTSAADFAIANVSRQRLDFSTGVGVDRWAWGAETSNWSELSGQRRPSTVTSELSSLDYDRIATSNATGDDGDSNRYVSPVPTSGATSTHIYEFTVGVDPASILELGFEWEGYGDACYQVELYVWDDVAGDWCDGAENCGLRRYVDNTSGNEDQWMRGSIRQNVDRYIDPDGKVTLLVYTAPTGQETFHDYVAMTVTHVVDTDGDSLPDDQDCAPVDGTTWALPGEVTTLSVEQLTGRTHLTWVPPSAPGATSVTYDVLAAPAGDGFAAAACLLDGTTSTEFDDTNVVDPGELRAFLVRATNDCGSGGLGPDSSGDRPDPACQ